MLGNYHANGSEFLMKCEHGSREKEYGKPCPFCFPLKRRKAENQGWRRGMAIDISERGKKKEKMAAKAKKRSIGGAHPFQQV
ncbi:hypothetical protein A5N82_05020 [Christensenella minuta]|jgi:hypothetical protein|uniref:Uncharacterized protein n=1 Tax=Christensenella minuta TaxID=626937 RepID=A0A136Q581_9FIRM|nr:hypothetical protein B1H56_12010 [Christensenella minuta]KXK65706.1 hypothetical protein HMPREF3293_01428 [Christensenella minuta]OAQ40055.1 hypothetical protein A5N82_05020 [Christensenella minuta]